MAEQGMGDARTLLELRNVTKRYDGAPSADVLAGVNLSVAAGASLAIVGPSGSGKSTLLNLMGALDRPTGGQVMLDGRDLSTLNDNELAELRNRRIGFVFQLHHLLPQCNVLENVLLPTLAGRRGDAEKAHQRARRLLERVGMSERLSYRPGELSGGERQRVAVVRALINRPQLLLADEPTGSLDRAASDSLAELLIGLNRIEGVTLIVVTHSMRLAERMGRLFELRDGALIGGGER